MIVTCPNAKGGRSVEALATNCAASLLRLDHKVTILVDGKSDRFPKAKGLEVKVVESISEATKGKKDVIAHDCIVLRSGKLKFLDCKGKATLSDHNALKNVASIPEVLRELYDRNVTINHKKTGIGYVLAYALKHA